MPPRLLRRWSTRLRPVDTLDRLVEALQTLLQMTSREDPFFLTRGLNLLLSHLGASQAYLVAIEDDFLETRWWAPEHDGCETPAPIPEFCSWLLANPHRTMVLRDLSSDRILPEGWARSNPGILAAAGTVLWGEGRMRALLFAHFSHPHPLDRTDLALLDSVAGFLSRLLEVENLKTSLHRLENALAITRAVVEDSSIHDAVTRLPNLRYLDIWLKANLAGGAPTQEDMTLATWRMDLEAPEALARLQAAADQVRGGDLLVHEGAGKFFLILQRTPQALGQAFLSRIQAKLGEVSLQATLWVPGVDDPRLESARRRLDLASPPLDPRIGWT